MTTVALVAARNAAGSIADTVAALNGLRGVAEVWVVDDGSDDDTAGVAVAAGAQVVRLDRNRGKGGALAAGVAATPRATRYLLADADLGATATGLQALLDGEGDLVVGVLPSADGRGGFGNVVRLARAGIRRATAVAVDAPLSGQRVVDARLLRSMTLAPRFGVEVGMTIDALRGGAAFAEVPVQVEHHHRGRTVGGFTHRARQGIDIIGALVPRLLTPAQQAIAIVLAALAAFGVLTTLSVGRAAPTGQPLPSASKVVLFAYDGLSIDDVDRGDLSALQTLRRRGASGVLTVRTSDRRSLSRRGGSEGPSPADAYASLGASARVRFVEDMTQSREQARRDHADSLPGALGEALRAAGKSTGVAQFDLAPKMALADSRGFVSSEQPFADVIQLSDVVIFDPRRASLPETDAALRSALRVVGAATVIVFAPTPPGKDWELTPIVIVGEGIPHGSIASATTRRAAMGGLVDLAPTVLTSLGVDPPAAMTGAPLRVARGEPDFAAFERAQIDGSVRSRFFLPAAVGYTVVALAFYLAFMVALGRGIRRGFRVGVCALAAFPFATLLTGGLQHWAHIGGESPALLVGLCLAIGALVARLRGVGPAYVLAALTLGVLMVDVAATGPLQSSSILGYTLQTTGRYYGLPNASFAVYVGSLFLVAAAVAGWKPTPARALGATAVVAVGTAFVAAPWLGNDVGGTLTLVPVALAASWAWLGRRFTPRVLVAGVLVAVVALVVLTLAESVGGGSTHLTRAVGDGSSLGNTLTRRVNANFGLLVDQWWGFLSLALAAGSIALLALRRGLTDYLPARSGLRVGAYATLVASIVGFLANDSGPVVNVLCLVVLAPAIALTALAGRLAASGPGRRS